MDAVPPELAVLVWKARFQHDALAVARCPVYTKVWRDARLCCRQAADEGKFIALLFAPNAVFMRSLDLKARLTLPTQAERTAAMIQVREINGKRRAALMTEPIVNESKMEEVTKRNRLEIELTTEMLKALCFELNQILDRPWKVEHLELIIVGFAHFYARLSAALNIEAAAKGAAFVLKQSLKPKSLMAYMRSYEEMVTQTEEREREMKQRFDSGVPIGEDWVSAALNCGRGINALREAGKL